MIKRKIDVEVKISPEELAKELCDMDSAQQTIFINALASISREWGAGCQESQLYDVFNETYEKLSNKGKRLLRLIKDYIPEKF